MTDKDTLIQEFKLQDSFTSKARTITQSARAATKAVRDFQAMGSGPSGSSAGGGVVDQFRNMLGGVVDQFRNMLGGAANSLPVVGALIGGVTAGIGAMGVASLKAAADFDRLKVALQVYSGSASETERQFLRLQELAKRPGLALEQVMMGAVRLQAGGMDFRLAERAMAAFGNALASSGGSAEDLDGVFLALTQIAAKGEISAEEINQLQERIAQIRPAMQAAFGTADTEALGKMGITAQVFIAKIIDEFEKMPKAADTIQSSFDNASDAIKQALASVGAGIATSLIPQLKQTSELIAFVAQQNLLGNAVAGSLAALSSGNSGGVNPVTQLFIRMTVGIERMPIAMEAVGHNIGIIGHNFEVMGKGLVTAIVDVAKAIRELNSRFDLETAWMRFTPAGFVWDKIVGGKDGFESKSGMSLDFKPIDFNQMFEGFDSRVDEITRQFLAQQNITAAEDTSKGGFRNPEIRPLIAESEKQTRVLEEIRDIQRQIFGGGDVARNAVSAVNLNDLGVSGGRGFGKARALMLEAFDQMERATLSGIASQRATYGR